MKKAIIVGLTGFLVLSAGADWRVAGFPNQVFSDAVVEKTVADGGKPVDVNYWFIDAQRAGRKFARAGTSLAFGATAEIASAGDWRFRVRRGAKDGFAYELYANGVRVADFPDGVKLVRGTVRFALFARLCEGAHPTLDFVLEGQSPVLEGQSPGAADFAPLKTVATDPPRVPAPYETALRLADARHIRQGWRTFKLKVDEPGLYDFAIQMPGQVCYIIRAYLDDLELLCVNSPGANGHNAFFGPEDRTGDGAVVAATVRFGDEEIAELKKHLGEIRALGPYARTTDEAADFAALLAPLEEAARKGDCAALRIGTLDIRTNHRRWFEICGWPADFCVVRHDIGYQACGDGYRDMYKNFDEGTVETRSEDYRKFLAFPQGKTMKYYKHGLGGGKWYEIQVTGIFGGGYGDIRVTREGKELGVIRAFGATPRLETRILPVKIQSPGNGLAFELTGLGEKGLTLLHCGAREVGPTH